MSQIIFYALITHTVSTKKISGLDSQSFDMITLLLLFEEPVESSDGKISSDPWNSNLYPRY